MRMPLMEHVNKKYIYTILEKLEDMSKEEKIAYLQSLRNDKEIYYLLKLTYMDKIKFKKLDIPPFKSDPTSHPSLTYTNLRHELRRFYIFLDRPQNVIPYTKLINNLVQILESIPAKEAEIVVSMLEKRRLPYKRVTQDLVKRALPELFPDE